MASFHVNQNNQWFTVIGAASSANQDNGLPKVAGEVVFKKSDDGKLYFMYNHYGKASEGNDDIESRPLCKRSEVIEHLEYIKYTPVEAFAKRSQWYVSPKSSSMLESGKTYLLTVTAPQYHAIGEYHRESFTVSFTAKANSTVGDLILTWAKELKKYNDLVGSDGFVDIQVVPYTPADAQAGTQEVLPVLVITEKEEQKWRRGAMFNDYMTTLEFDFSNNMTAENLFDEYNYGHTNTFISTVYNTNDLSTAITISRDFKYKNSQEIADMEYFYLGEHGDLQRDQAFPYNLHKPYGYYKVNDQSTDGYDLFTIHHHYVGNGTFTTKSEQDITICVPNDGSHTVAKAIVKAIKDDWKITLGISDYTNPKLYK